MTTIIVREGKYRLDDKILQDLGYTLKWNTWSKKVEMAQIREEIERLQVLKILNIEVILD